MFLAKAAKNAKAGRACTQYQYGHETQVVDFPDMPKGKMFLAKAAKNAKAGRACTHIAEGKLQLFLAKNAKVARVGRLGPLKAA